MMAVKGVSVDLKEDLHRNVKAEGQRRGQSVPEAYTEALQQWLRWVRGEDSIQTPLGDVTGQELHLLSGLLAYLRQKPYSAEKSEIIALFERLANRGNTPIAK